MRLSVKFMTASRPATVTIDVREASQACDGIGCIDVEDISNLEVHSVSFNYSAKEQLHDVMDTAGIVSKTAAKQNHRLTSGYPRGLGIECVIVART